MPQRVTLTVTLLSLMVCIYDGFNIDMIPILPDVEDPTESNVVQGMEIIPSAKPTEGLESTERSSNLTFARDQTVLFDATLEAWNRWLKFTNYNLIEVDEIFSQDPFLYALRLDRRLDPEIVGNLILNVTNVTRDNGNDDVNEKPAVTSVWMGNLGIYLVTGILVVVCILGLAIILCVARANSQKARDYEIANRRDPGGAAGGSAPTWRRSQENLDRGHDLTENRVVEERAIDVENATPLDTPRRENDVTDV